MALANNLYKTAKRLIDKFGSDVTLHTFSSGVYDPLTGSNASTATDTPTKAFISSVGSSNVVEGVINIDDSNLLLLATDLNKGDFIQHRNTKYKIIAIIERVEAQNLPIIFTVIGRSV